MLTDPSQWYQAYTMGLTPGATVPGVVGQYTPGLEAGTPLGQLPEAGYQMQRPSPADWARLTPRQQQLLQGWMSSGYAGLTYPELQYQWAKTAPPGGSSMALRYGR